MQINKSILRNSETVIFDKKNNFAASWVSFFSNPLDQKQIFFHVSLTALQYFITRILHVFITRFCLHCFSGISLYICFILICSY